MILTPSTPPTPIKYKKHDFLNDPNISPSFTFTGNDPDIPPPHRCHVLAGDDWVEDLARQRVHVGRHLTPDPRDMGAVPGTGGGRP